MAAAGNLHLVFGFIAISNESLQLGLWIWYGNVS